MGLEVRQIEVEILPYLGKYILKLSLKTVLFSLFFFLSLET